MKRLFKIFIVSITICLWFLLFIPATKADLVIPGDKPAPKVQPTNQSEILDTTTKSVVVVGGTVVSVVLVSLFAISKIKK